MTVETDVIITTNAKGCDVGDIAVTTCNHHVTSKMGRRVLWASRRYVTKFTTTAFCLPRRFLPWERILHPLRRSTLALRIPPKGSAAFTEEDRQKMVPVSWDLDCGERHVIPTVRPTKHAVCERSSTLPTEEALHLVEKRHRTTLRHETTESGSSSNSVVATQSDPTPATTQRDASTLANLANAYNSTSVDVEQLDGDIFRSNTVLFMAEVSGTYTASTGASQENAIGYANCERVDNDSKDRYDELEVIKRDLLPRARSSKTAQLTVSQRYQQLHPSRSLPLPAILGVP